MYYYQKKNGKHSDVYFVESPHLLFLLVSSPFGSFGAVDGFGLRTVNEVQQLIHVPVVNDASCRQVRVLTLRKLLFAAG